MLTAVTMVPHRTGREVSHEGPKLTRAETELRKCLSTDTDEILLKSYSCAWQKEILVQGRLYITPHHFCFYSSILGFETKMTIRVRDIMSIKKEKTAHLFPNAIVISTAEKRYGFSTFANRNKSYKILHMVWQNEISQQPMSGELLLAKIQLLKGKSKSVECSPASSPQRPSRRPIWQLSLSSASKSIGHTDSDSSGTSSPVLLSRTHSPPIPTVPQLTPSHTHGPPAAKVGVAPKVVVTTYESSGETVRNKTAVSADLNDSSSSSSHDSLFVDATDSANFEHLNSNSDKTAQTLDLNSDSCDTSWESGSLHDDTLLACSTSTDSEAGNGGTGVKSRKRTFDGKLDSVSTTGRILSGSLSNTLDRSEDEESGILFLTREKEGESCTDNGDLLRGPWARGDKRGHGGQVKRMKSVISEVLGRVHALNPTQVGLWRLQRAIQDWCTPSNFINLLIVISIVLLLLSTASMLCRLSHVNPTFQPLIAWQPWCRLSSDCQQSSAKPHPPVGGVSSDSSSGRLWTVESFEEMVRQHSSSSSSNEPPQIFNAENKI